MYIVGHLVITEKSGFFPAQKVYGEGAYPLLLPDYVRCHEWGYERCFRQRDFTSDGMFIQAHIIADWYAHYGEVSDQPQKRGWVYRQMGVYTHRFDRFFSEAARLGLREDKPPVDSKRGFAHTMMEYSIDTFLVRRGDFNRFEQMRAVLGRLGLGDGAGSKPWLDQTLKQSEIDVNDTDLERDVALYRQRVLDCKDAEEFAYRAGVYKFGLKSGDESVQFIKRFVEEGLEEIPAHEISNVVEQAAGFVATWLGNARLREGV